MQNNNKDDEIIKGIIEKLFKEIEDLPFEDLLLIMGLMHGFIVEAIENNRIQLAERILELCKMLSFSLYKRALENKEIDKKLQKATGAAALMLAKLGADPDQKLNIIISEPSLNNN